MSRAPDPGEGVVGPRELEALATKELHRSRRYGRSFSLAVVALDLDGLSHDAGPGAAQAAARGLAAALSRVVREADTLARISDGEHHLLLPETDPLGARILVCRAWEEIRREPGLRAGGDRSIRAVSMGTASFPADGGDHASLLLACRRRQAERRSSMLFRGAADGLGAAPSFWHLADALLDGEPIPDGSPSARLPLDPDLLDVVEAEVAREIGRDLRARGVVYVARPGGCDRMLAALPRLDGAARQGDTGSRVYVLGAATPAARPAREHALVARVRADADRRLEDHSLLLFLSERASYALLQAPDGRLFHTSDAPLVDALTVKLQAHYRLPPPLERGAALAPAEQHPGRDGAPPGGADGMQGSLAQIPLVDVLQMLAVNRSTGRLEVARDGARGEIAIADGRAVDAAAGAARGEKAVFRLLSWREGRFAFVSGGAAARRRIEKRVEELALEGMRQADEAARVLPGLPGEGERIRLSAPGAPVPAGLGRVAVEVASLLARPRTVPELLDAASASDLEVLQAVAVLLERGHARREPLPARAAAGGALLLADELAPLRRRLAVDPRSSRTAKVVLAGGGPLTRRAALVRLAALPGFAARSDGAPVSFGTVGTLSIGERAYVDVVALPSDPALAPLWRPFATGALAALVLSPAEEVGPRLVELGRELPMTFGACGPSSQGAEPAARAVPPGCAYLGADPAEALRRLLALAGRTG